VKPKVKPTLRSRRFKVSVYISRILKTATSQKEPLEKRRERTTTKNSYPNQRHPKNQEKLAE
jgi:hypothetical protein